MDVMQEYSKWGIAVLAYQTLGVVYGDLGTSPLYVYPTIQIDSPQEEDFLGILSLIFWTLTMIGLVKYVFIVLQANDHGDGKHSNWPRCSFDKVQTWKCSRWMYLYSSSMFWLKIGRSIWGLIIILGTLVNNMQEELLLFILCYVSMQILARMLGRSCKSMNLMCCWVFMVALGSLAPSAFWRVVCFGRKCCFLLSCWAQVWLLVMVSSHLQSLVWMMTSAWNDFQSLLTKSFPY